MHHKDCTSTALWFPGKPKVRSPVQLEVLLCPESWTSNKINPKPTKLPLCFHCLLKRAARFGLQTLRLFSKKTFWLSPLCRKCDCSRCCADATHTEKPHPARRMAYHCPAKWQINKASSKPTPEVTLQQQVCKHRNGSVSQLGAKGQCCNTKPQKHRAKRKQHKIKRCTLISTETALFAARPWSRKVPDGKRVLGAALHCPAAHSTGRIQWLPEVQVRKQDAAANGGP